MRQSDFAKALLDPEHPAPPRFSVHRNSVTLSLIAALETGFPVTRHLVGPEFFAATAGAFLRQHPPTSPILMLYGADFPRFLQDFLPAQSLPYLPDLARLEQALRESYHAADSTALPPAALKNLSLAHRLTFAPALRLVRSDWPVWAIWTSRGENPPPEVHSGDVLVLRHGFDPAPHPLPPGSGAVLQALLNRETVQAALSFAPEGFDLAPLLTLLLCENGLVSLD